MNLYKSKVFSSGAAIIAASLFFTACLTSCNRKKDDDVNPVTSLTADQLETASIQEDSQAQEDFDAVLKVVEDATESVGSNMRTENVFCGKLTLYADSVTDMTPITTTKSKSIIVVDYGDGTTCDGWTRKGKIIIKYSGRYRTAGTVIVTTLDSFEVKSPLRNDFRKVEGVKIVTNKGKNASNQSEFSVEIRDAVITSPAGLKTTWKSTRTRTWISGEDTQGLLGWTDDAYLINGSSEGTSTTGITFTTTLKDIKVDMNCWSTKSIRVPTSGKQTMVTKKNGNTIGTREIDYGTGDCDRTITFTILGISKEITL